MNNFSLIKKLFLAFAVVFAVSCDSDFNDVGSDIIDDDLHSDITRYEGNVVAYDRATGAVQTNNMPVNSLGIYTNPAFGTTKAHFVTQLELELENPSLSGTPEMQIDSVFLYVPYFSTANGTDLFGDPLYNLDSVYGNPDNKIRLHVYENGYYLRSTNAGSPSTGQKYFSDEKNLVEENMGTVLLNNSSNTSQNEQFYFNNTQEEGVSKAVGTSAPGIYMDLDTVFFSQKILHAPAGKLLNNNVFKDYFRGIYFNVEQLSGDGAMASLDFNKGYIKIIYTDKKIELNGTWSEETEKKSLILNMSGNTINFFENTYNTPFTSAVATSDQVNGDERLYIKGGEGSMAVLDILNDADLDVLKPASGEKVLINEANLTFYIDQTDMGEAPAPRRLYLYDLTNGRPLYDYYIDETKVNSDPKSDKYVFGGFLDRDGERRGYKIRLTNHINNIINKDSTNVKLGLVLTENINLTANAALKTPFGTGENDDELPAATVVSPLGVILYGNNTDDEQNRLKLEVYYTKINE